MIVNITPVQHRKRSKADPHTSLLAEGAEKRSCVLISCLTDLRAPPAQGDSPRGLADRIYPWLAVAGQDVESGLINASLRSFSKFTITFSNHLEEEE